MWSGPRRWPVPGRSARPGPARLSRRTPLGLGRTIGAWGRARAPQGVRGPQVVGAHRAYGAGEGSSVGRTQSAVAVHSVVNAGQTGPDDKARLRRPQSITEEIRYEELG